MPKKLLLLLVTVGGVLVVPLCVGPVRHRWQVYRLASAAARPAFRVVDGQVSDYSYRPLGAAAKLSLLQLRAQAGDVAQETSDARLRGNALLLAGRTEPAIDSLRRAAEKDENVDAWSDLAVALADQATQTGSAELLVDAIAASRRAIALHPAHAAAYFNLAVALERLGLTTEARQAFETSASLDRGSPWSDEAEHRAPQLSEISTRQWKNVEAQLRDGAGEEIARASITRDSGVPRRSFEDEYLTEWARAVSTGETTRADELMRMMRIVARAFQENHADRFFTDVLNAVDRAVAHGHASEMVRAQLAFADGRSALRARDSARALASFGEAAKTFERLGSPMTLLTAYFESSALYGQARIEETLAKVAEMEGERPDAKGYRSIAARMGWHQGIALVVRGQYADAIIVFQRCQAIAAATHDRLLDAQYDSLAAEAFDYLGESTRAWLLRIRALRSFSQLGNDQRTAVTLMTVANLRLARREWERSLMLVDYAVPLALRLRDPVLATLALAQRAIAEEELGDSEQAASDRDRAVIWLQKITDPTTHVRLAVEVEIAKGIAVRNVSPHDAISHFTRAITEFRANGETAHLPRLYLERGRAYDAIGLPESYRTDLLTALQLIDSWREGVGDLDRRAALNVWGDTIRRDAIDLELRASDVGAAFSVVERMRSSVTNLSLAQICSRLAPDAAVVEYAQSHRGMIAFVVRSHDARAYLLPAPVERIAAAADRVRSDADDTALAELHRLVVAPIHDSFTGASILLVIPERELTGIPFGALYDAATNRALIEEMAVIHSSGVGTALVASRQPRQTIGRMLAVGADDFDHSIAEALPRVAGEAVAVTRLWPQSMALTGGAATADTLRRELPGAEVVHYAGHIVGEASGSRLLLSGGSLSVHDIADLPLDETRVVVLAACRGTQMKRSHLTRRRRIRICRAGARSVSRAPATSMTRKRLQ